MAIGDYLSDVFNKKRDSRVSQAYMLAPQLSSQDSLMAANAKPKVYATWADAYRATPGADPSSYKWNMESLGRKATEPVFDPNWMQWYRGSEQDYRMDLGYEKANWAEDVAKGRVGPVADERERQNPHIGYVLRGNKNPVYVTQSDIDNAAPGYWERSNQIHGTNGHPVEAYSQDWIDDMTLGWNIDNTGYQPMVDYWSGNQAAIDANVAKGRSEFGLTGYDSKFHTMKEMLKGDMSGVSPKNMKPVAMKEGDTPEQIAQKKMLNAAQLSVAFRALGGESLVGIDGSLLKADGTRTAGTPRRFANYGDVVKSYLGEGGFGDYNEFIGRVVPAGNERYDPNKYAAENARFKEMGVMASGDLPSDGDQPLRLWQYDQNHRPDMRRDKSLSEYLNNAAARAIASGTGYSKAAVAGWATDYDLGTWEAINGVQNSGSARRAIQQYYNEHEAMPSSVGY